MKSIVPFFSTPGCPFSGLEDLATEISLASHGQLDMPYIHTQLIMAGARWKIDDTLLNWVYMAIDRRLPDNPIRAVLLKKVLAKLVGRRYRMKPLEDDPIPEQVHIYSEPVKVEFIHRCILPAMGEKQYLLLFAKRPGYQAKYILLDDHTLNYKYSQVRDARDDGFSLQLASPIEVNAQDRIFVDSAATFWWEHVVADGELHTVEPIDLPKRLIFSKEEAEAILGMFITTLPEDDEVGEPVPRAKRQKTKSATHTA